MTKYYLLIWGNWNEVTQYMYGWRLRSSSKGITFGMKVTPKTKTFHVEHTPNLQVTSPKQAIYINGKPINEL